MINIFFALLSFSFCSYASDIIISDEEIWTSLPDETKLKLTSIVLAPNLLNNHDIIKQLKEISEANFNYLKTNYELKDIGFTNRIFFGEDFSSLALLQNDFSNTIIIGCSFKKMDLSKVIFEKSCLSYSNFEDAKLTNANFQDATTWHTNFFAADLSGANFSGADLQSARFSLAQLTHTNFTNTKVFQANFNKACMRDSFRYCSSMIFATKKKKLNIKWLRNNGASLPQTKSSHPKFSID